MQADLDLAVGALPAARLTAVGADMGEWVRNIVGIVVRRKSRLFTRAGCRRWGSSADRLRIAGIVGTRFRRIVGKGAGIVGSRRQIVGTLRG